MKTNYAYTTLLWALLASRAIHEVQHHWNGDAMNWIDAASLALSIPLTIYNAVCWYGQRKKSA